MVMKKYNNFWQVAGGRNVISLMSAPQRKIYSSVYGGYLGSDSLDFAINDEEQDRGFLIAKLKKN